ncbi:MAG TPA: ABC transporter permease [Solirubrobacterales bacterium]|nr:ABC transporter permease [Solirubrobacterales bacterium]
MAAPPLTAAAPAARRSLPARAWKWLREHGIVIYAGFAIAYMLIPIFIIAVFSFNDPAGKFNYTWQGFSLATWEDPFALSALTDSFLLSLRLAALSTLGATILGTLIALALVRYEFFGRRTANFLIVIPMATPEVVIGAALLSMFLLYFGPGILGFTSLLIAHIMFSISFVVVVVRSRLIGFDRSLEEAARDLGASPFHTFRLVTLPLMLPGIVAAGLLAFALSIDDFVISNFNAGTAITFPLYIYGAAQRGIPVEIYVLATMLFVVTVAAMILTVWQQRRAERMTATLPEAEEEPYAGTPAAPPVPGAAGG